MIPRRNEGASHWGALEVQGEVRWFLERLWSEQNHDARNTEVCLGKSKFAGASGGRKGSYGRRGWELG